MNRKECLEKAIECVTQDRNATHGEPETIFQDIANFWNDYLGGRDLSKFPILDFEVGPLMGLFKIARIKNNPNHVDSWVDSPGYLSIGCELATREPEKAVADLKVEESYSIEEKKFPQSTEDLPVRYLYPLYITCLSKGEFREGDEYYSQELKKWIRIAEYDIGKPFTSLVGKIKFIRRPIINTDKPQTTDETPF